MNKWINESIRTERLNRIEPRGLPRGEDAGENADAARNADGENNRNERQKDREEETGQHETDDPREQHADCAADAVQPGP